MAIITAQQDKTVAITMRLSEAEAMELMAMVQNPIIEDESDNASRVRMAIFHALREAGIWT